MFQYDWFEKKEFFLKPISQELPEGFIRKSSIQRVRELFWEEHCLECAMPLCYRNCEKYVERKDGRCKKTHYGIRKGRKQDTLQHATVKFESWGKLETVLSARVKSPGIDAFWDKANCVFSSALKQLSNFIRPINNKYIPTNGWNHVLRGWLKRSKAEEHHTTPYFLFQCYSYEEKEYNLFFEMSLLGRVYCKKAFVIRPGYNQYICYIEEFKYGKESLVRIYPENNINAEMTIFALDFVSLDYRDRKPAPKVKCVAWDLDNTLWNGILIESDPEKLCLRDDVLTLLTEFDRRGIIQIVVSKNTLSDVEPLLQRLNVDHFFVYKFVNWNSKSNNLIAASNVLNINIDTFALVDDSEIERREISELLPCARVYSEKELMRLLELEEFDVPVTEDSMKRREMYQTEAKRRNVEKEFIGTNLGFLKSCEIKVEMSRIVTEEQFDRVCELNHRTNQLNLSGVRYEREQLHAMISGSSALIFACHDKYGTYGTVGFILYEETADSIIINEFAMSCRVASKCVEAGLMKWLQNKYRKTIIMRGTRTDRNNLLIETFVGIGFDSVSDSKIELVLPADSDCVNADIVTVLDELI